jgi:hypothetical protein
LWINIAYLLKQFLDIILEKEFIKLMKKYDIYFVLKDDYAKTGVYWATRIASIPIFFIKATNSFFMVALPMQLLYKVRYLPGMSIYLPKFFIAIQQIKGLVLIFITFTLSFVFSYTILTMLDFRMGSVEI